MTAAFQPIAPGARDDHRRTVLPCDWRRPSQSTGYQVHWRASDGFGQLIPRPDPAEIPAFYDIDYYTHGAEDAAPAWPRRTLRWLIYHLSWRRDDGREPTQEWWATQMPEAPAQVLDLGCGSGANLDVLRAMGHTVTGVEPDPAARQTAQDRGLEVFDGTAEALPAEIADARFDVVLMSHVLEHCLDPLRAIENARSLLAEDGLLIIEVPNNACRGQRFFDAAWYWLDVPRHLNFFNRESLTALFQTVGLAPCAVEFTGYNRQFSRHWVETQAKIAEIFGAPNPTTLPRMARYLAQTAFATEDEKYDSIRVLARAPKSPAPN